jgi:hypothetical protein
MFKCRASFEKQDCTHSPVRKSDHLVVAEKWGNAHGVKGVTRCDSQYFLSCGLRATLNGNTVALRAGKFKLRIGLMQMETSKNKTRQRIGPIMFVKLKHNLEEPVAGNPHGGFCEEFTLLGRGE